MHSLSLLEKEVVATGLLKKMINVRFVTTIFILKEILPILAKLRKTFQAGTINYACIQPCILEAKDALKDSNLTEKVKTAIIKETGGIERLGFLELTPTEAQLKEATGKMAKYVEALINNLDERFGEAAPILAAFSVFDPCLLPDKIEPTFKYYGDEKIDDLGSHFLAGDEEAKNDMFSERMSYKYNMLLKAKKKAKARRKGPQMLIIEATCTKSFRQRVYFTWIV